MVGARHVERPPTDARVTGLQTGSCSQLKEHSLWILQRLCIGVVITLKVPPILKIATPKGRDGFDVSALSQNSWR